MSREAHLLSPYRPPTSYPVSLNPDEAEAWLNGYFALWHPLALRGRSRPPQASSSYDHDLPGEGFLYALATGPHLYQPDDWKDRVRDAGGAAFIATVDLQETLSNLLAAVEPSETPIDPLHVRQFAAVGFGYLLVESLFDAMQHDHLLDAEGFWSDITAAVDSLFSSQPEAIRGHLRAAVDKLNYARQSLTSNPIRLFDFAIPEQGKLDAPWPASLAAGLPINLLISGELLTTLAEQHPERLAELKQKLPQDLPGSVDVCMGAFREREDALLPAESQFWNWRKARSIAQKHLGVPIPIAGRRRTAFHPSTPSWLQHAGFKHALTISFDGALTPMRNSAVVSWQAPDGKTLECFGREPLSASDPLTFFNLVYYIHQATSQDASPAVAFKHVGERAAVGYQQLVDLADLGDAIGEWTSVARFLGEHHYGDYLGNPSADDYFADYLDERVTQLKRPEPVSGFAQHLRLRRKLDSAYTLAALQRSLSPETPDEVGLLAELDTLEEAIETRGADLATADETGADQVERIEAAFARKLAERVQVRSAEGQPGLLVFNPCNFTRRIGLEIEDFGGPIPVADAVKAAEFQGRAAKLVVEVPSLGFAWIPRPTSANGQAPKPKIKTAEGSLVRNEFLEADFDPVTGALRSFRDLRTRINRLGMQMVFNPGCTTRATSVSVTNAGTALGEVVCAGEILDEHGGKLAGFRNRIRAWIGRPALELRVEIDPVHKPTGYPWHAYYGARFVWRDERAAIFRGVQGANVQSTYTRPVSPDYLELRLGRERTFVFTGGLPFIQKHGGRMADVVLIPEGEQARSFDLLLACDRDYPMQTAAGWVAPAPIVETSKGPPHIGPSGWLGHVDLPSLLLTSLRPCMPSEGATRAIAARLIETAGFGGASEVRFARDAARAWVVDGDGQSLSEIAVQNGGVPVDFSANETFRIRVEW